MIGPPNDLLLKVKSGAQAFSVLTQMNIHCEEWLALFSIHPPKVMSLKCTVMCHILVQSCFVLLNIPTGAICVSRRLDYKWFSPSPLCDVQCKTICKAHAKLSKMLTNLDPRVHFCHFLLLLSRT